MYKFNRMHVISCGENTRFHDLSTHSSDQITPIQVKAAESNYYWSESQEVLAVKIKGSN